MADRPTTSAGPGAGHPSYPPQTADSAFTTFTDTTSSDEPNFFYDPNHPDASNPHASAAAYHYQMQMHQQHLQQQGHFDEEDEEEYESEDEDVFAYLPPSTAEAMAEREAEAAAAAAAGGAQRSPPLSASSSARQHPAVGTRRRRRATPSATATSPPATGASTTTSLDPQFLHSLALARQQDPPSTASPSEVSSTNPFPPPPQTSQTMSTQPWSETPPGTTSTDAPFGFSVPSTGEAYHMKTLSSPPYADRPTTSAGPSTAFPSPSLPGVFGSTAPGSSSRAGLTPISGSTVDISRNASTRQVKVTLPPTTGSSADQDPEFPPPTASDFVSPPNTANPSSSAGGSSGIFAFGLDRMLGKRRRERESRGNTRSGTGTSGGVHSVPVTPGPDDSIMDTEGMAGGMAKKGEYDPVDEGNSVKTYSEHASLSNFPATAEEDSPYPEVRASVSNTDDIEMPATTVRMWFLGLLLCIASAAANTFFNFRFPAPYISALLLLLLAYPAGKLCAYTWPIKTFKFPDWLGGYEFSLNPGPFNIKEHVLIFIMANVSITPAYALNTIVVSDKYYDLRLGTGFNVTIILATQLTGFGLAGMCRRFLVWPASMIWPQNLVTCALLNTLHAEDDEDTGGGVSKYKFFMYATVGAFFWYFLPGFLFQALSIFSWVCWMAPKNVVVNQLFGVSTGLGFGVLTFDWAQIVWIGSPLMIPWWAEVHIFFGFVLFYWILCPILYYTDVWRLGHLPITANLPFDRFAQPYNVSRVLTPDHVLNVTAYNEYSDLYLPASYAITYLLAFALASCVIVHTALYHGRTLLNGIKNIKIEEDDVHARLMRYYPEVPDWWYLTIFITFFVMAIVTAEVWDTGMPVWAIFLALTLPVLYILPSSFIFAVTGQAVSINLLAEIIPGTLLSGKPLPNMIFKAYSVQTMGVALTFVQDLKLGHYMKIPPRATFMAQSVATILASLIQVGVQNWLFSNTPDICTKHQPQHLVCPHNTVYFTASAIWGLIGPVRQFGKGELYHPELYALAVGAILPVPFWLWQRKFPKTRLKYINTPVLINGPTYMPPATGINYSSWFVLGFIFQSWIRRRHFRWWSKFNYILSAAMDSGTILSILFIFVALQLPKDKHGNPLNVDWWGNNVFKSTSDYNGDPFITTDPVLGF